ncbi:MAG: fumarylacetoacetate hydrolase family protein [Flavobacteriales bacterium]
MKIICIGRNYQKHIEELNNQVPEKPLFFIKPDNSWLNNKPEMYLPNFSSNIHYELEVVVKIDKVGKHISEKFAHKYYSELSVGLDFTARDLQSECKEKGLPWEIAKGFDHSAPVGRFISKENFDMKNIDFSLENHGEVIQKGNTSDMITSLDAFIAYVSQFVTIKKGDLIFTGTPAGVGQVKIGDHFTAFVGKEKLMDLKIK